MATTAAKTDEYELVLMLDPEASEDRREEISANARKRIESAGSLKHDSTWGMRKLAYEIRQRTEADYRFFRFETGGNLLDDLTHNLKIADGVLRFRIFKVDPRTPVIVPPPPTPLSSGRPERGRPDRGRRGDAPRSADEEPAAAPVAPVEAPPQAPAAEQPAAEAPEAPVTPAEEPTEAPAEPETPEPAPAAPAEGDSPPSEGETPDES